MICKYRILVLLIAVIAMISVMGCSRQDSNTETSQTKLDEIISRGTIRCGWVTNPPACYKDPETNEMAGTFVELMEQLGTNLSLKIEWTEEVGFGSMIEGLNANRYDLVPSGIWPSAARAREADFSTPLYFSPVYIYARANDRRFVNNFSSINSPSVTVATIDGEMVEAIVRADFPEAKTLDLPQMSDISTMLLNVKEKKADVTFVEPYFAYEFVKNNPGSLEIVNPDDPIRIFPNTVLLPKGEIEFKETIDIALRELVFLGVVDRLISKYEPAPNTFLRLSKPFEEGTSR